MNRGEMKAYLRRKLQDEVLDYLWQDEELEDAIQDAQCEAAYRCNLIFEKDTPTTTFNTAAGVDGYAISRLFYRIDRVLVSGREIPKTTKEDVERRRCVTPSVGKPCEWFRGDDGRLHFDKAPNKEYQVKFEGCRYPAAMADDQAECEVPDDTGLIHRKLLLWAMKLLKEKEDLEVERQGDAVRHEQAFEREFGPSVNVAARVSKSLSRRHQTRVNW